MFNATEQVGELDMGEVPRKWRRLDYITSQAAELSETDPVSMTPASVDVARPGGHRLYAAVDRALSAAGDCDRGLRALLEHHGATQTAMWALLRTQFEASFWALWLMDPEDTKARVLRGIQHEWLDSRASTRFYTEFTEDKGFPFTPADRDSLRRVANHDHAATYRAEAAENGADWVKPPPVNMTDELTLLRHASEPGWGSTLRGTWRSLAGLQHGSAGALLRASDQTLLGAVPGGMNMRLSPSDGAFVSLASITIALNMAALSRYVECHRPYRSNAAIDLAEAVRRSALYRDI